MKKNKGFTLAEVLITLTIIGVVAALTIPSLLANVSDKTYDAKRKGFTTRMAQAISQIGSINAYEAKLPAGSTEDPVTYAEDNSSMNFIVEGLSKVYKLTNVCEFENFAGCDFPSTISLMQNSAQNYTKNTEYITGHTKYFTREHSGGLIPKSAFFRTKNGESVQLYYNPRCVPRQTFPNGTETQDWQKELCAWMIFDLDGARKGPNKVGKDIGFISVFYPDTPYVVAANGVVMGSQATTSMHAAKVCEENTVVFGHQKGEARLGSLEEIITTCIMYTHCGDSLWWSGSIEGSEETDYAWAAGERRAKLDLRTNIHSAFCVLKDQ